MQTIISQDRRRFGATMAIFARKWRQVLEQSLTASGLSDGTWPPLVHLLRLGDGVLQRELAAAAGLDDSSLVRHLDSLARAGLLERRIDPADRRARRLYLTETGRIRAEDIAAQLHAIENDMLEGLPEDEIAAALSLFEKIEQRLSAMRQAEASK